MVIIKRDLPNLAMISSTIRRDLQDPIRFFSKINVTNYYRDIGGDIFNSDLNNTYRYYHPLDLYQKLHFLEPDVIQGVEPFCISSIPFILSGWWFSKQTNIPLIVVSLENRPLRSKYGRVGAEILKTYLRPYFLSADLIIFLNNGTYNNFLTCDVPHSKMVRLMYGTWGIDTREFSPVGSKFRVNGSSRVILFIGRIVEEKGIFDLAQAFSIIESYNSDTGLVIIGTGKDLPRLRSRIQILGIKDKVHFVGLVNNDQISKYLRGADLVVSPSISSKMWEEQVGMVNLQAMACGVPIVSTLSGAIPEYVENGYSGILVPEKHPALLAKAILNVLNDHELRKYLSQNGRVTAIEKFDAQRNIKVIEDKILDLI